MPPYRSYAFDGGAFPIRVVTRVFDLLQVRARGKQELAIGFYLLVRDPTRVALFRVATHPHFAWTSVAGCPDSLPMFLLQMGDARALAAELSCGQDIAGTVPSPWE